MNQPNPKKHQQISLAKSSIRITGYIALLVDPVIGVILLVASEILGILEELV
jgi:hypothetical protein